MKRFLGLLAAFLFAVAPVVAFANPLPYYNQPFDTPNSAVNAVIAAANANVAALSYTSTCSGTTTATCVGLRNLVSITGLTTAGTAVSATMTVTDASVTAASQVICNVVQYGGAGVPNAVLVVAAAGSYSFAIQNSAASAALNATVVTACYVYN